MQSTPAEQPPFRVRAPLRVVLIGVGNSDRGDDAAGLEVLGHLQQRAGRPSGSNELPADVSLACCTSDGDLTGLIDALASAHLGVVCDAVASGAAPGQLHVIDASRAAMPADVRCASSHALGLAEAIELMRALDQLPPELWVYGVEGDDYDLGARLSVAVRQVLPVIAERIWADVAEWCRARECEARDDRPQEAAACTRAP